MRIGELLMSKVGDINLTERKILIHEWTKNSNGRVVYISDDAVDALNVWLEHRDPGKEYVFYGHSRPALCYSAARVRFMKYIAKAGLVHRGYTLHCLRHTYATELLNAGMRLEVLQQLLGHTNIEVTRRYARLTDKTREADYFRAMSIIEKGDDEWA
jgi:integrase